MHTDVCVVFKGLCCSKMLSVCVENFLIRKIGNENELAAEPPPTKSIHKNKLKTNGINVKCNECNSRKIYEKETQSE